MCLSIGSKFVPLGNQIRVPEASKATETISSTAFILLPNKNKSKDKL